MFHLLLASAAGVAAGGYACWLMMEAAEGWRAWAWGAGVLSNAATFCFLAVAAWGAGLPDDDQGKDGPQPQG